MPDMPFLSTIHPVPVLLSGIAAMIIGMFWYSPLLFARPWLRLTGFDTKDPKQMQKDAKGAYAISFIAFLIEAAVLSHVFALTETQTIDEGMILAFCIAVGFTATVLASNFAFYAKSLKLYWIDVGYQLVVAVVMGAILAPW